MELQQTSFRETMGPVYFELVDLLLQRAASLQDPNQVGPYLIEARESVELFKAAELRDYFRDDCVDTALSKVTQLDVLAKSAVVIYPILLPDRIELLVSLPTGLKRVLVPVGAETSRKKCDNSGAGWRNGPRENTFPTRKSSMTG
mgnify:CR=1 FL=1